MCWWGNWKSDLPDHGRCVWSCSCRWGDVNFPTPPTLLLNSTEPPCACLVFLHFSLSVSDLASFLLSLFHSDSPDGKLISTVWEQTYRQTQTAPDSTGASSSPSFLPLLASLLSTYLLLLLLLLCLHTHPFSKWKRPVSSLLSVLSSSPGPSFSSFRPSWVLLLAVSVWTVAVGGWRIALSERARAGSTCSACSDTDSEYSFSDHSPPSRIDLSRDCLCYCLSFHACTWLCHFVRLKDMFMYCTSAKRLQCHCTKKPPAEWPL